MDFDNNTLITDDAVGTDPTLVQVIDSLDVVPETEEDKKKSGKKKGKIKLPKVKMTKKNILVMVVSILLIFGVGFGLFFYLGIGTGKTKTKKTDFSLNDITITAGETLSLDVTKYGNFNKIDIAKCTIDGIRDINTNNPGKYDYSITCNGVRQRAKIIINPRVIYATMFVTKNVNSTYDIKEFVTGADDYKYEVETEIIDNALKTANSFVKIPITIEANNKKVNTYALLYVKGEDAEFKVTCTNPDKSKFKTYDVIPYNNMSVKISGALRYYEFTFNSAEDMIKAMENVVDGIYTSGDISGNAVVDLTNNKITIVKLLTDEILKKEFNITFPDFYFEGMSLYSEVKNYSCTF